MAVRYNRLTNGIRESFSVAGFIFTYVQQYFSGPFTGGGDRSHRIPYGSTTAYAAILIFSSLNSLIEKIANPLNKFSSVIIVLTLFQALAFLIPGIHLDPEDISSPCPN